VFVRDECPYPRYFLADVGDRGIECLCFLLVSGGEFGKRAADIGGFSSLHVILLSASCLEYSYTMEKCKVMEIEYIFLYTMGMEENIIDLKKKTEAKGDTARNEAVQLLEDDSESHEPPEAFVPADDANNGIEWETDEYEKISKSKYWYGGAAAFLFLLVVIGVIARSYFFIVFIVFAAVLFLYYSLRTPRRLLFSVTPDGISAGSKVYSYSDLKSFWIFDRKGKAELSLETTSVMNSVVVIPIADVDIGELRQYLTQYAEEAEHIENFFDRVSRFIGI